MGSFLQTITQLHNQEPTLFQSRLALISQPIEKVKQYYGLFKSVCDSFLITKDKYLEIFDSSKNLEEVWDREKTNKIDALELFSGLIAYSSESTFKQKLKFWFVIFDFNQIKNLSFVDVEYLTLCVCNATFKLLGKNAKANESEIVQWLKPHFSQHERINITKLHAFCVRSFQIKQLFQLFQKPTPDPTPHSTSPPTLTTQSIPYYKQSRKQLQDKLQWHRQFSKKLSTPYNPTCHLHSSKLGWIYGVRVHLLAKPFLIIQPQTTQPSPHSQQQQIIYSMSTIIILYNLQTNKQRHYRGHTTLIKSFVYSQCHDLVISAGESLTQNVIHIWSYRTLRCLRQLSTYQPVRSLMLLGKEEDVLVVVCEPEDGKTTVMIFSLVGGFELMYSHTYGHKVKEVVNVWTNVDEQEVRSNVWGAFVAVCEDVPAVVYSEFQWNVGKGSIVAGNDNNANNSSNTNTPNTCTLKTLLYDYYQQPPSPHTSHPHKPNHITSCIALYLNQENPLLRSFITNDESLSLCIITGHMSGHVKSVFYSEGQFSSQDTIYEPLVENPPTLVHNKLPVKHSSGKHSAQNISAEQSNLQENSSSISPEFKVTHLTHTETCIIFSIQSYLIVLPFSYLTSKQPSLLRKVNIADFQSDLKLFSTDIRYFAVGSNRILLVTQKQGDFISIQNRTIMFSEFSFVQKQSLKRIKTLTKLESTQTSTMCLLQKLDTEHLIYLTTGDRRILIINSFTHEVENVWEVNSTGDHITAIDAVYTDEDVMYFVCGCKEGKLYIRVDNEDNPKFYDCGSQIIDIKLSKDASYLLVSTIEKYLYFFTQINKNFSSPRKLHFQNQIPVCMNFLDSNKMFSVNTSAKNAYVIEIPQLKHKNIQKQEKISISKMKVLYPQVVDNSNFKMRRYNMVNNGRKNADRREYIYTKAYLGGQLRYFVMTMHYGDVLFFQNRQHLSTLSYVYLPAHWGQISTIAITQPQDKFYTLGKYDNMLVQWTTKINKSLNNIPQSVRLYSQKATLYESDQFQKMKEMSFYYKLLNECNNDDIYLFKGTKNEKLNEALRKRISNGSQDVGENGQKGLEPYMPRYKWNLRQPNLELEMGHVYGLQCYKRGSVKFFTNSIPIKQTTHTNFLPSQQQTIIYHCSSYLLSLALNPSHNNKRHRQQILTSHTKKISMFAITQENTILYALCQPNTPIRILHSEHSMTTTHQLGIIHMATFKNFVVSYGIMRNDSYSINLHDYSTRKLLAKRTTELKIHQFLFINEDTIVSLNEIRIWKELYPGERLGKATAGILLPNGQDVCLATDNGSISILSPKKGIFTIVTKAHQSDITCMTINLLPQTNPFVTEFQLLTISKDDKIKIWNEKFSCKLMINLRQELFKNVKYLSQIQQTKQRKQASREKDTKGQSGVVSQLLLGKENNMLHGYRSLNVRGMDSRKGKILLYLASGQVYLGKFTIISKQSPLPLSTSQLQSTPDVSQPSHSLNSSLSNPSILLQNQTKPQHNVQYEKQWQKLVESHSSEYENIFKRFLCFSVHPEVEVLVSVGGNDRKVVFWDYKRDEVVDTYFVQEAKVRCVKFSEKGRLLVLGFSNGTIKIYTFQPKYKQGIIKSISLYFSQKFTLPQPVTCQPLTIHFSPQSLYFSVSFIGSLKPSSQQQLKQQSLSFVNIYRQKQQYSTVQNSRQDDNQEENFYSLVDTVYVKDQEQAMFTSNRYTRCVWNMVFVEYDARDGFGGNGKEKEKGMTQNVKAMNCSNLCLVMYEQYVNENLVRLNLSDKDRFTVYIIQEKVFAKKQFQDVNWTKVYFPQLVNVQQINRFKSQLLFLNTNPSNPQQQYPSQQQSPQKYEQNPLSITSMCYFTNNFVIYGGSHGKLHLLRTQSLLTQPTKDQLSQLKQHQMSISKTYVSQFSQISSLQLSHDRRFLFVGGQVDEAVVKYKVRELVEGADVDYQLYDVWRKDQMEMCVGKDRFYSFVNSVMPLREEIRNVLEDVEGWGVGQDGGEVKVDKDESKVGLQVIKVIGRRAYDRCNNLYLHHDHLIYTIGPNLIIQSILDPFQQTLLPSDPHPLSYSPQISTIHMTPNSNLLILATQEEAARLFVWDIRASICLSEMQVNCSVVYGIRMVGERFAVFYGINSMYQLVVQVVDWKDRKVVAVCNLLHSSTWKIRSLLILPTPTSPYQQSIKFLTCGTQHLSSWSIQSNTLIQTHFPPLPPHTTLLALNHFRSEFILAGCQKGIIYLFKNQELIQQLKVQVGPVRAIEVVEESSCVIVGGLDSVVTVCKLEEDELYVESGKSLNPKPDQVNDQSKLQQSNRGQLIMTNNIKQSNKSSKSKQNQLSTSNPNKPPPPTSFLTQFDIQSIIYSPLPLKQQCNFFCGTRSGDVYFCQYNLKQKQFISISQVVYGQDHETIVSTAFNDREQILYTLTTSGKLQVYDLKIIEKVLSYKFMKKAKILYTYKNYLMICFEKEIIFIQLEIRDKTIKIYEEMTLEFDGTVSQCVMGWSQTYLAVGLHKNQANEILVYEIEKKSLVYHSPMLKYEIQFLDFSTDEKYLLYKDKFQEIGMIYLVTLKRINTIFVEMKIEWQTQGLRISPKAQKIYSSYNCQNRITTICKISPNYILVGDEMGTLRIFPYPPQSDKLGELHTACYTQHMNKINSIKQHKELTYVATTSVYDRSLIVWRKSGV